MAALFGVVEKCKSSQTKPVPSSASESFPFNTPSYPHPEKWSPLATRRWALICLESKSAPSLESSLRVTGLQYPDDDVSVYVIWMFEMTLSLISISLAYFSDFVLGQGRARQAEKRRQRHAEGWKRWVLLESSQYSFDSSNNLKYTCSVYEEKRERLGTHYHKRNLKLCRAPLSVTLSRMNELVEKRFIFRFTRE